MPVSRRADAVALVASLAIHAALVGYVMWSTSTPELDFEFQLPIEVEFGMTEAVEVSAGAATARTEPPPAAEETEPGEGEGETEAVDAGVPTDGGPSDGGAPDGGRGRDAGPSEPLAAADVEGEGTGEEGDGTGDEEGEGRGVAFLPAGSQIALRIDVARVSRSPLAPDVRSLLQVLPDWRVILDGSGIEPLDDLDRILIASPNLQRSRIIVAGRSTGDQTRIRRAAAQLAIAASQPIEWTRSHGVEVAPWHDRDETERIIAIIGPRHFLICRPEDLPRVLAVARNRAAETDGDAPPGGGGGDDAEGEAGDDGEGEAGDDGEGEPERPPAPRTHPADALLSMEEGEGLSLEVEGARNFARASRRRGNNPLAVLPTELRLSLSERPGDEVAARTTWTYEGAEQASEAGAYWNRMREQFSRNIIAGVLGVDGLLRRATLEPDDDHLDGSVDLRVSEMRQLLNLSRQMFLDRARARERAEQRRRQREAQRRGSGAGPQDTPSPAPE